MNNISFVIPAYNSASTIKETLDSVLNGNFEYGDEIIVVNDGSTDNTLEVLKKFEYKIKIIENPENIGCPASRNVGISAAKYDLIFSLDADNILEKEMVNKLKESLIKNRADIVSFGGTKFFLEKKNKITHRWIYKRGWFTIGDLFSTDINPAPGNNILFTKETWQKTKGFAEIGKGIHEGWIFIFNQLKVGSKFYVEPNTFYYHRWGYDSLFVREKKQGKEAETLVEILEKNKDMFTESDFNYMLKNNPQWFHNLTNKPIKISGFEKGKNGKLIRTPYGIYKSVLNKINEKLN
jgi:glycosyltransferase involved in cell wall biosynthesis